LFFAQHPCIVLRQGTLKQFIACLLPRRLLPRLISFSCTGRSNDQTPLRFLISGLSFIYFSSQPSSFSLPVQFHINPLHRRFPNLQNQKDLGRMGQSGQIDCVDGRWCLSSSVAQPQVAQRQLQQHDPKTPRRCHRRHWRQRRRQRLARSAAEKPMPASRPPPLPPPQPPLPAAAAVGV
jgi:hypothetical protein